MRSAEERAFGGKGDGIAVHEANHLHAGVEKLCEP
jgi:hypothetical protein